MVHEMDGGAWLGGGCCGEPAYLHGPDSKRQDGVPKGVVTRYEWRSQIYAGAIREYFV